MSMETKIKLCGMTRACDIDAVNELRPDYVGFVFWPKSKRCVSREQAMMLKSKLDPAISAVGVFIDEEVEVVAALLNDGIIDIAQLHGTESEEYMAKLRELAPGKPIFRAFRIKTKEDAAPVDTCTADCVLLDSGAGTGKVFDWELIKDIKRPYFLAGGLDTENVTAAVKQLTPYGVDVSSGIETDRLKDKAKMTAFVERVRRA